MTKSAEDQPIDFRQGADGEMDSQLKILIGEAVLAKVQRGDWSQGQLNELLHSELKTDQADRCGAFQEDALSEGDASGSSDDLAALGASFGPESDDDEIPVFLDAPRSDVLPTHFTTLLNPDAYKSKSGETATDFPRKTASES